MAIPSSRALFACAIPTIIVILSYIWFNRKKRVSSLPWIGEQFSPLQLTENCDTTDGADLVGLQEVASLCDSSLAYSNFSEDSRSNETTLPEMVVKIVIDSGDPCKNKGDDKNDRCIDDDSVILTSQCSDGECITISSGNGKSPPLLQNFNTHVLDDTDEFAESASLARSEIRAVLELPKDPEQMQFTTLQSSDKSPLSSLVVVDDVAPSLVKDVLHQSILDEHVKCPSNNLSSEGLSEACQPIMDVTPFEESLKADEPPMTKVSGNGSNVITKRISGPVFDKRFDNIAEPLLGGVSQSTMIKHVDGDLIVSCTVQDEGSFLEKSIINLDLGECNVESNSVTQSSDCSDDQRSPSVASMVHSSLVSLNVDTNTSLFDVQMPTHLLCASSEESEEFQSHPNSATAATSAVECESKGGLVAASIPGLSGEDPELQKLAYQNSTSAYGSASHSPADGLESPTASNYSDLQSEGSSDSGKGGSDIHTPSADGSAGNFPFTPLQVYEFELPQDLCGRLIGQRGRYVNLIKNKTNASISVKRHPFNPELKLCAVLGTEEDINAALMLIRKRFPLSKFPVVNMVQVNAPIMNGVPVPDTLQLHLPDSVTCDVILSSLVNAGHFFVQQPTHPTYSSLSRLDQFMLACYVNGMGAPELPAPVEAGIICAASTMGGWYRAQIVYVYPDSDECEVKFVDYGGYSKESVSSLRQIRSDFMTLPFQASECFLANVSPIDENQGWTLEASSCFEELAQGQILQARIVAYSDEGIPYVHLYRIQGVLHTFINQELVGCGHAKWTEHQA